MQASEHDGEQVLYIDAMRRQHSGVIVGQSEDGGWFYVQSDNLRDDDSAWHFQVARAVLPGVLVGSDSQGRR